MRSLLLVSLLLAPCSYLFGQAESAPANEKSRQEAISREEERFARMLQREVLQSIDTNHDGQIDADELKENAHRSGRPIAILEDMFRKIGIEPKYPIKISEIQDARQKYLNNRNPDSLISGQTDNPVPRSSESSRQERGLGFLKQIDANHDGQIDTEEIQAVGPRAGMIEGLIRRAGLEPKYPIKISDIQAGLQNVRTNGGQAVAESPKELPKFKTLKEILEAMPRKPEKDDNHLAAMDANDWLRTNVLGSVIQITGREREISTSRPTSGGFSPRPPSNMESEKYRITIMLERQGLWEGISFFLRAFGDISADENINAYYKIKDGDEVTLEGRVTSAEIQWVSGKGKIQLSLAGCKLVSVNKPEAPEGITKKGGGTLVISGSNTYTGEAEASKPTPAKTKINTGTTTVSGGILTVQKAGKFWTYATENGEYAIQLDEVDYVQLLETKSNNPMNWHIFIHLKTKDSPILLDFNEKDKARIVYQSLLQALDSGSGSQVIEGIGANPEADVRGTVRIPSEKPKPPEEKKERNLFD